MIDFYLFLHLAGILMVFSTLGGALTFVANGSNKADNVWRKRLAITHGIGLTLLLVSGFGMLARLGIHSLPNWAIIKLVIWLILGFYLTLIYKKPSLAGNLWWLLFLLGGLAAFIGIFHFSVFGQ
jgi:hypothetical protein